MEHLYDVIMKLQHFYMSLPFIDKHYICKPLLTVCMYDVIFYLSFGIKLIQNHLIAVYCFVSFT